MKQVSKFFLVIVLLIAITSLATISAATGAKVQAFNGTLTASANTIAMNLMLVNTGTDVITLSNVKMRYYFTNDGTQTDSFACDWCSATNVTVTGTFVNITPVTNADR
jgi:xyloglucan-specific exo-beta-1,4-glucanase